MNQFLAFYSKIKTSLAKLDRVSFFYITFFLFISIMLISSIDPAISKRIKIKEMTLLKKQIFFSFLSLFIILAISSIEKDSDLLFISIFFYTILYLMIIYLIIFRRDVKGSSRWLYLFGFSIQPSDIMKPFFIVLNANIYKYINSSKKYLYSIIFFVMTLIPIILQPDIGTSVLYFLIWSIGFFISGAPFKMIASISTSSIILGKIIYELIPNVQNRIKIFFMSKSGTLHYQIKKSIESINQGGFFGKGLGEGTVKYELPDSYTDYIFSVMIEEFGIFFSMILVDLFLFVFLIRILMSKRVFYSCYSQRIIVFSLCCMFLVQCAIHVSVNLNIIPNKGMTFPFISYGGSSLISSSISFGIILIFTKKKYKFTPLEKFI